MAGTRRALRMPRVLREEESITPMRDRLDTAHSGVCSAAESDRATISPSRLVIRQDSTASASAPTFPLAAFRMPPVTTSRHSSMMANCRAQQAAAVTGRCCSIPVRGRPRDR